MVLETKRLLLREMNMDDHQALFLVLGDPETMRHYPHSFDVQRVKDWIKRNMDRYQNDGFGLWAVCLKETGELIGDCGLTLQNINGEVLPEIGYHIRRDCQRKGYAGEAAKAVRDWAFRNTDYPTLYSYCKYTNVPSIKTAESIGMHFVCEYPDETNGMTHDGRFLDLWADKSVLDELKHCFAHYAPDDCKRAIAATHRLFARLARAVADKNSHAYPESAEKCTLSYIITTTNIKDSSWKEH